MGLHHRSIPMRWCLPQAIVLVVTLSTMAQPQLDTLRKASDAGQQAFERAIGGDRRGMDRYRIHPDTAVDVLPQYPGGAERLALALITGGDTSLLSSGTDCLLSERFTVRFIVGADGSATHAQVIGVGDCPVLEVSVRSSVQRLERFSPGLKNGVPVRVRMEVPLRYDPDP